MIRTGLVSITFRQLAAREIVRLASEAGLQGIEVASYGSYYRAATGTTDFEAVLQTAIELHAPVVRVWAGDRGSADSDAVHRERVIDDSRRICESAGRSGIQVAFEYHVGTLTDTALSTIDLLRAVDRTELRTYWQPRFELGFDECLDGLDAVLPWLANVHVFTWSGGLRLPLADGRDSWMRFLGLAHRSPGDHFAMLEFVRDDSPEAFVEDARTLREMLSDPRRFAGLQTTDHGLQT